MQDKKTALIHHISRLEGQLASVKKELADNNTDCEQAARTLKAASRSFSTLRKSFVTCFLETKYLKGKVQVDSTYEALLEVITA